MLMFNESYSYVIDANIAKTMVILHFFFPNHLFKLKHLNTLLRYATLRNVNDYALKLETLKGQQTIFANYYLHSVKI